MPSFPQLVLRLLGVLLLLAVLVVGATAARIWQVARQDDRSPADAIIVLGASQFDGRPSSVLEARLEHAEELYYAGVAPRVVTLGGAAQGDRFTEAEAGARYLAQQGVEDTVAIGVGNNTLESLEALRSRFTDEGWQTAVLVTDPWHALRSRQMAEDLGIDAAVSPTRRGPSVRTRETQVRYIARETAAYLYYRLFGASTESGPDAV